MLVYDLKLKHFPR